MFKRPSAIPTDVGFGRHCAVLLPAGQPAKELMRGYQLDHPGLVIDRGMMTSIPTGRHALIQIVGDDDTPTVPISRVHAASAPETARILFGAFPFSRPIPRGTLPAVSA